MSDRNGKNGWGSRYSKEARAARRQETLPVPLARPAMEIMPPGTGTPVAYEPRETRLIGLGLPDPRRYVSTFRRRFDEERFRHDLERREETNKALRKFYISEGQLEEQLQVLERIKARRSLLSQLKQLDALGVAVDIAKASNSLNEELAKGQVLLSRLGHDQVLDELDYELTVARGEQELAQVQNGGRVANGGNGREDDPAFTAAYAAERRRSNIGRSGARIVEDILDSVGWDVSRLTSGQREEIMRIHQARRRAQRDADLDAAGIEMPPAEE